jgi:hypothetical protein
MARHCLACHTTTLPASGLMPEDRFFNVGCESCHGPGAAHIAAIRAGRPADDKMEPLENAGGVHILALCGKCHRTQSDIGADPSASVATNRFQPYGLSLSRCFRESGDKMSCLTCHNPHTSVSTDLKSYDADCLTCHSPHAVSGPTSVAAKPCPVSPATGCIGCHMPTGKVFKGSAVPTRAADHFIRIFPNLARLQASTGSFGSPAG